MDDIVQSVLADALASSRAPEEPDQIRRWVFGIARHKVADYFRRSGREGPTSTPLDETVPADSAPLSARDLLRWAEQELPDGDHAESTLKWMMREAAGDKLESIAEEEQVPAPRVRQRVARLRRHFRERWALAAAVVAVVVVGAAGVALLELRPEPVDIVREMPSVEPTPLQRANELRRLAFDHCDAGRWQRCLDDLDQAAAVDPAGDRAEPVRAARQRAAAGLAPSAVPTTEPTPSAAPSDSVRPAPVPTWSDSKGEEYTPPPTRVGPDKASDFDPDLDGPAPPDNAVQQKAAPKKAAPTKPAPKKGLPMRPPAKSKGDSLGFEFGGK